MPILLPQATAFFPLDTSFGDPHDGRVAHEFRHQSGTGVCHMNVRIRAQSASAIYAFAMLAFLAIQASAADGLVWQTGSNYRFASLKVLDGQTGFSLLNPHETGITFSNVLSEVTIATNRLLEIGSGVALGDVDGDGWVDVYFCRIEGGNVLYRNLGNWQFEDVTERAGVACPNQHSTGCVLADVDGDGDLDLLVNNLGGGTRLFINDGHGHFAERTDSGLFTQFGATSMALADANGDGLLDLYVTNYRTDTFFDHPADLRMAVRQRPDGEFEAEPRNRFLALPGRGNTPVVLEKGEPDVFYLNRGGGRFAPIPWQSGLFLNENGVPLSKPPTDWGLAVAFRDLNGDGRPDLYVCNDFIYWPDRVWINQGGRQFRAAPVSAFRCTSLASMAVDVADINRDGFYDLFVADMLSPQRSMRAWRRPDMLKDSVNWPLEDPAFRPEVPRNTLHLARGDGTYSEIAQLAGVSASDWTTSVLFLDVDLDGWEDLLLATGNQHDVQDLDALRANRLTGARKDFTGRLEELKRLPQRNAQALAFRNRHDLTFEDVSTLWGFNTVGIAHGMALADLDNDGDLDVVVNCMNAPARVYRNNAKAPRIGVRLRGQSPNTRGIGARIKVSGGPVTQTQEMIAGGRFCSSDDPMRVFAAGTAGRLEIEVLWPNGRRSVVPEARPNCIYEIAEEGALAAPIISQSDPMPLFEDVSARLNHQHIDQPFDDFVRQPLLPHRLSTLGPGLSWGSLDSDGHDSLLIPDGKGGHFTIFRGTGDGHFTHENPAELSVLNSRDQTTVLIKPEPSGSVRFLIGESNWEDGLASAPPFRAYQMGAGLLTNILQPMGAPIPATGPLALADLNGNGRLALFIGGRAIAGRYPSPATSYLLEEQDGHYHVIQTFPNLGLVSGAVFTDLDGDGYPDLALACEWNSIHIFHNEHGKLVDITASLGLSNFHGWWNGIAAGDFDGDGRMDLVVSNWGHNWRPETATASELPVHLFYGQVENDGVMQTLLASIDPSIGKMTPWRERKALLSAIPSFLEHAPDYHAYSRLGVEELLGKNLGNFKMLQAETFDSMVFLNRGERFEAHPLPIEAQFTPAFGVCVADFDGDGKDDIFLAQNFFGTDAESSRQDAGAGLILLGDGRGNFRSLSPQQAGIHIPGEQRGSAVADFDEDGRVDLAVAQHGGPTKLFRNVSGKPGVRVTLHGPGENWAGVGASVRLKFGEQWGPAREIHGGGGYWSQDSATLILAAPVHPDLIEVRWPGGQTQSWKWPGQAVAVTVDNTGVTPKSARALH